MAAELDDLSVDADYLKGFNEGYLLREAMPELAARLEKALDETTMRSAGFKNGYRQYELDKDMQRQFKPDWLKGRGVDQDDVSLDKDINRDDLEMEQE